ncbi:helicase associated domain-containing protein [Streptomyces sp. NPDC053720]|uniref:helicase associated domain-containing protein n=1 Tax=Streptomyces sp. NPDC053720 TaxID=3154855 RepID=UPI00343B57FD
MLGLSRARVEADRWIAFKSHYVHVPVSGVEEVAGTLCAQFTLEGVDGQVSAWTEPEPRTVPDCVRLHVFEELRRNTADQTDPLVGHLRAEQSIDQHARQSRAFDEIALHRRPAPDRLRLQELDSPLRTACRVPTPHVVLFRGEASPRHGGDDVLPTHSKVQRSDGLAWNIPPREAAQPARRTQDDMWAFNLAAAHQNHAREGHLRVPRKHTEHLEEEAQRAESPDSRQTRTGGSVGVKLATWFGNVRKRANKLSTQRRTDLDAVGMRG